MNNLDCKQLTESDFFKNKIAKKEKKENKKSERRKFRGERKQWRRRGAND